MSQRPQQQGPNWMTMLLFFIVAYLGITLLVGGRQQPQQETRSAQEMLTAVQKEFAKPAPDDLVIKQQLDSLARHHPESKERAEAWSMYARVLEDKGNLKDLPKRNHYLDLAEQEYTKFKNAMPEQYERLVPKGKLEELHAELNRRYRVEPNWGIGIGYQFIDGVVRATGRIPWFSYAFATLVIAIVVRALTYPFAQSSFRMMRQMRALQPVLEKLKERYEGRELLEKQQEVFRQHGVNQFSGCLAMFLPLPFMIWVYHVMRAYRFEFEHGTFLWINPTISKATGGLVGPNLGSHDNLLLILYAFSMYLTQRMMVTDKTQEKQQKVTALVFSVVFLVMMYFWRLPSAFLLYWLAFNILSTAQQVWVNKQPMPVPAFELPEVVGGGKGTGVPKQHKKRRR